MTKKSSCQLRAIRKIYDHNTVYMKPSAVSTGAVLPSMPLKCQTLDERTSRGASPPFSTSPAERCPSKQGRNSPRTSRTSVLRRRTPGWADAGALGCCRSTFNNTSTLTSTAQARHNTARARQATRTSHKCGSPLSLAISPSSQLWYCTMTVQRARVHLTHST